MNASVLCHGCGQRVPVPEGHARPKIRCAACGVMCEVPAGARQAPAPTMTAPNVESTSAASTAVTAAPPRTKKAVLTCPECGERVRLAPSQAPICPTCGTDLISPAAKVPADAIAPGPPPKQSAPVPSAPKPLIVGSNEDDDKPYTVPGDAVQTEPCPSCNKSLPRGAVVCVHCGFDQQTGEKTERVYEKIDKQWEPGLPHAKRLGIFLVVEALALAATLFWAFVSGEWGILLFAWSFGAALLAFVLGTYPRVNLRRNAKGRCFLTRTFYFAFIPRPTVAIPWRECEGIVTGHLCEVDFWDWVIVVMILFYGIVPGILAMMSYGIIPGVLVMLFCGIIPGVLWWIYIVAPGQFHAALTKDHGYPAVILYRGRNEALANEIAVTVSELTGLPYPPLV
jgi:hypothetical protein